LFIRGISIGVRIQTIKKGTIIRKKMGEREIIKIKRREKKRDMSIRKLANSLKPKRKWRKRLWRTIRVFYELFRTIYKVGG
jgi:hypothetical protein